MTTREGSGGGPFDPARSRRAFSTLPARRARHPSGSKRARDTPHSLLHRRTFATPRTNHVNNFSMNGSSASDRSFGVLRCAFRRMRFTSNRPQPLRKAFNALDSGSARSVRGLFSRRMVHVLITSFVNHAPLLHDGFVVVATGNEKGLAHG